MDDAFQTMGYGDDPQTKAPSSAILTLAVFAAMELGGKHNKVLALAKNPHLFTHLPSPSCLDRRLHALAHLFPPSCTFSPGYGKTSTRPRPTP